MEAPINVWNEVRISSEGISVTLLSEKNGSGAVVEDEAWFTFDELDAMSGDIVNMSLSGETRESLVEEPDSSPTFESPTADLERGAVVLDENAPDWSENPEVEVVRITDTRADEWTISGGETVADANPSYPDSDPVVLCNWVDDPACRTYPFPASRLKA